MKNNTVDVLTTELKESKNKLIKAAQTIANNLQNSDIDENVILKLCEEVFEYTRVKNHLIELIIEKNKSTNELNQENVHLLSILNNSNKSKIDKIYKVDKIAKVALEYLWNAGNIRWIKPSEFLIASYNSHKMHCAPQSVYCNYSKLGLEPLQLIEKNDKGFVRLSENGVEFIKGKIKIPNLLIQNPKTKQWMMYPKAKYISYDEIVI